MTRSVYCRCHQHMRQVKLIRIQQRFIFLTVRCPYVDGYFVWWHVWAMEDYAARLYEKNLHETLCTEFCPKRPHILLTQASQTVDMTKKGLWSTLVVVQASADCILTNNITDMDNSCAHVSNIVFLECSPRTGLYMVTAPWRGASKIE